MQHTSKMKKKTFIIIILYVLSNATLTQQETHQTNEAQCIINYLIEKERLRLASYDCRTNPALENLTSRTSVSDKMNLTLSLDYLKRDLDHLEQITGVFTTLAQLAHANHGKTLYATDISHAYITAVQQYKDFLLNHGCRPERVNEKILKSFGCDESSPLNNELCIAKRPRFANLKICLEICACCSEPHAHDISQMTLETNQKSHGESS